VKAARSRLKRPRPYRVSGFHALVRATTSKGLSALDGRSTQARALKVWKAQVAADLGDDLTAAQRTLLDVAAVDMALLSVADAWLREHAAEIVNKRRRTFVPLVAERLRVASHLADLLRALGLERRAKVVPSISQFIAERAGAAETVRTEAAR
jgi:hypothetical protein